jgi:CHAT domain-containing protein
VGEEIEAIRRTLGSSIDIGVLDATPKITTESLRHHHLAHFTCHGGLEKGKPFDASFKLYGGKRLTLLDMVRSQLPTAEFAFLSACHTAELTDGSIADEALHLTAAMQHCGFRSVVGTMWAMADKDGRRLAEHLYKSMFSSGDPSILYYERSAEALRDAAQTLRKELRQELFQKLMQELRDELGKEPSQELRQELRQQARKQVGAERWVNFVHYGA